MKILQIVENLDKGAVENWLVRMFLNSRKFRADWEWTFYCIVGKPGRLDKIVEEAGGKIIYSPYTVSEKYKFLRHLRTTLKQQKFDIIHSHHDYLSGFYLIATFGLRFNKRILHIHNTDKAIPVGSRRLNKILLRPFKALCYNFSDLIVGISEPTLLDFTGKFRNSKPITSILYYGIDLAPFKDSSNKAAVRQKLGIGDDKKILLFVGRMNELKNPLFVLDILKHLKSLRADAVTVFLGEGDLVKDLKEKSAELGLQKEVLILGWSDDIASLMRSSDVFVFPRLEYPMEGLGITVLEAQSAGLQMVISRGIVPDAIVISELTHVIKLNHNPDEWAEVINQIFDSPVPMSAIEALAKMEASPFELNKATQNLLALYE